MCGIVGVIGERNATPVLIEGLRRLEYRGYDSAGIAVVYQNDFKLLRATGKLKQLEKRLQQQPVTGFVGIGHTRWATHGAPTRENAHPHRSANVVVVHNGIIENYQELREKLIQEGASFSSETDTEVIPHLIEKALNEGLEPVASVRAAVKQLEGAFALGVLFRQEANLLVAARRGSPLIVGVGEGENFIGSDATPLVPYTRQMIYLQDNDMAVLSREEVILSDLEGQPIDRPVKISQVSADLTDKGPYRHFMQKEIFEQPTVIFETLRGLVDREKQRVVLQDQDMGVDLARIQSITIVACGTSWHAGMVGKYWIERFAKIPVMVDIASEFRYRNPPSLPNNLTIVISQSGETADTLAALRFSKAQGEKTLGIVNVPESTIAREADAVLYTKAGPEIGVASTKAFTTQLVVLSMFSLALAKAHQRLSVSEEEAIVGEWLMAPGWIKQVLERDQAIYKIAGELMNANGFLFLGRGGCFPIALEGALKLKEISYIHAEGYAAGEMKHGPIALIDEDLPVVVVAPKDRLIEKVISNLEEVKARGGRVVVISPEEDEGASSIGDFHISMVPCQGYLSPLLYVVPLQLLAYHIAVLKGTDVDQPRNLAKSVTVE
ncbi:glutamine--fructose-6-phosphate transaminase (isomerizing) [Magnetococcales bacterium HHB-1]